MTAAKEEFLDIFSVLFVIIALILTYINTDFYDFLHIAMTIINIRCIDEKEQSVFVISLSKLPKIKNEQKTLDFIGN